MLCFRFAISFLILLPFIHKDKNFSFKIKFPFLLGTRIAVGILTIACYFYAIQYIKLIDAILLQCTFPIFVPIVIFFITRQKTSRVVIAGILISFVGIILVLHPGNDIFQPHAFIGLLSGILAAISFVILRILLNKDSTQVTNILFYYFMAGSLVLLPYVIIYWKPMNTFQYSCLAGIGIFGYAYQYLQTKALQYVSVRIASPLTYISVLVGGYFDWLIWDTKISYTTVIGTIITIAGAIIVILNRKQIKT
jgi:drug/metabolite transporter (DMT)-like permease